LAEFRRKKIRTGIDNVVDASRPRVAVVIAAGAVASPAGQLQGLQDPLGFQYFSPVKDPTADLSMCEMKKLTKFMQTVEETVYEELKRLAQERGITLQELLRAIIIPEWVKLHSPDRRSGIKRFRRSTQRDLTVSG